MTTITINISDETVVDEFASAVGYRDILPLTREPNTQTPAEFIKDYLAKLIVDRVSRSRSVSSVEDVKSDIEDKIT